MAGNDTKNTEDCDTKYTKNCISCKPSDSEEKARTIFETELVKVVLRTDNQCWLGRCIIVPKKHVDPISLWSEQPKLLAHVGTQIARLDKSLRSVFGASILNIAQLGNLTEDELGRKTSALQYHHCHFHVIPRYEKPPNFCGKSWPDPQWGKALNIDPKAGLPIVIPTSDEVKAIVDAIKNHL